MDASRPDATTYEVRSRTDPERYFQVILAPNGCPAHGTCEGNVWRGDGTHREEIAHQIAREKEACWPLSSRAGRSPPCRVPLIPSTDCGTLKGVGPHGQTTRQWRHAMEQARGGIEAQVVERAAKDPQFREQLKHDPRGTVARAFEIQIPPDITVELMEETPSTVYLVLPAAPVQRGQELTGQELESVAGGWSGATNECGTCGEESCAKCADR